MPISLASSETVAQFGHDRWEIENEGFNELVTTLARGPLFSSSSQRGSGLVVDFADGSRGIPLFLPAQFQGAGATWAHRDLFRPVDGE